MAAGKIAVQANDIRVYTITPEDGAAGNVSITLPKEGGTVLTTNTAVPVDAVPTNGSTNPVSSDGVFDALALKAPIASPTFTGTVTAPVIKNTQAVVTTTPASTVEFFYRSDATNGILTALSATAFKAWLESIGATGMKIKNTASLIVEAATDTITLPFTISNIAKVHITISAGFTQDTVSGFIGAYNTETKSDGYITKQNIHTAKADGSNQTSFWIYNSTTARAQGDFTTPLLVTITEYE